MSNETQILSLADINKNKITGLYFTLTVIEGPDFGLIFPLEKEQTLIGRKGDGNVMLDIELSDDQASRRHLMVMKKTLLDNTSYVVAVDLGSTNGTYINGKRINAESGKNEVDLISGDKIQIGNTVLKYEIKDNLEIGYQERLYQQVTRDAQTGLWNHNYVRQEMEKLLAQSNRTNSSFSVLMMTIDFLQTINETYGQEVGDNVLRATARVVLTELSDYEIAARFKGNHFLMVLPETDITTARNTAERLRQAIEVTDFNATRCPQRITVTIGVAQFPVCGRTSEALIQQADEALYRAQQVGRNRIGLAEITQPKQRNILKYMVVGLSIIAIVLLATLVSSLYARYANAEKKQLVFSGTVELHEVQVGSKIGGRVSEVLVKEGDAVKAGQTLVTFDISELLAERSLIEADIARFEANLEKLKNGSRPEEIAEASATVRKEKAVLDDLRNGPRKQEIGQAKADLMAASSELESAEITFQRIKAVYLQGYQSKQACDDAEAKVKSAQARVEAFKEKVSLLEEGSRVENIKAAEEAYQQAIAKEKLLRAGTRVEDIAAARAELERAKASLEKLKVQIAEKDVKAPSDCRVYVINIRPGDILQPGKPVAKLLEQDQIWVRIYVPHTDIAYIKLKQRANIALEAFPSKKFSGYVEQVAEEAEFYPRNVQTRTDREHQVFGVKVHIDNNNGELKSGMSADVQLNLN